MTTFPRDFDIFSPSEPRIIPWCTSFWKGSGVLTRPRLCSTCVHRRCISKHPTPRPVTRRIRHLRTHEQALVCLSNREIIDASRGRTFHCKMANNRFFHLSFRPNLFSHLPAFNYNGNCTSRFGFRHKSLRGAIHTLITPFFLTSRRPRLRTASPHSTPSLSTNTTASD